MAFSKKYSKSNNNKSRGTYTKKYYNKSGYKNYRNKSNSNSSSINGNYFTDEVFVKLESFNTILLNNNGPPQHGNQVFSWKGNSLFETFGTGDVVRGELLYYSRYKSSIVLASSVEITSTLGTNGSGNCISFAMPSNTSLNSATNIQYLEDSFCKWSYIGSNAGSNLSTTMQHYMTTSKMFGRETPVDDSSYYGTATSNPENLWYWNCGIVIDPDSVTTSQYIFGKIEIKTTYYVKFSGMDMFGTTSGPLTSAEEEELINLRKKAHQIRDGFLSVRHPEIKSVGDGSISEEHKQNVTKEALRLFSVLTGGTESQCDVSKSYSSGVGVLSSLFL